jgi:hypothetical protein
MVLAYLEGRNGSEGAQVVPLALARLEKLIEARLADVLPEHQDLEQFVRVKVLEPANGQNFPVDGEFYDGLVDRIMESLTEALFEEAENQGLEDGSDEFPMPSAFASDIATHPGNCDYFVGKMRCQHCKKISANDTSTHCETFLRDVPNGSTLGLGAYVGSVDVHQRPDYYQTQHEQEGSDLHVLEGWECAHCHQVNWAEVVVRDEHVASVWSIKLSRDTLMRAHLISSECVELASKLSGKQPWELFEADIVSVLLEYI